MDHQAWLAAGVTLAAIVTLSVTALAPDLVLFVAVGILLIFGIVSPGEALIGFTNEGLATIALLFIVVRGLIDTGLVGSLTQPVLGRPKSSLVAQLRLMLPVAGASAFINNTPVVAMLIPAVSDWAKRNNLHISQLMMPLSYAAIIGGTCTLIGTSTNLIINGLLLEYDAGLGLSLFEIAWIGIPLTLLVTLMTVLLSRRLLPQTGSGTQQFADARRYTLAMEVSPECALTGLSIEEAGLRQLPGMFLVEITRQNKVLPAVSPQETLAVGDILLFAGVVDSVVDLQKIRGLVPATNQVFKVDAPRDERSLVEVVVSDKCPIVGKSIKEGRFRTHYNAAVIAVARDGEQINEKLGEIVLKTGDMLLLDTHSSFAEQQRYSQDFLLASRVDNSHPIRFEKRFLAGIILLGMVIAASFSLLSMLKAAAIAAGLMVISGCTSVTSARRSVDAQLICTIAAAIALGLALQKTGAIHFLVEWLLTMVSGNAQLTLAVLFFLAALLTALVSNAATAVILFPVALTSSIELGVNPLPFVITLMIGASASFATPIGYQTNLMVYGPGGYRFNDFLKMGLPITAAIGLVAVFFIPLIWPF